MAWDALASYSPEQLLAIRQQIQSNPGGPSYLDPNTGMTYAALNNSGMSDEFMKLKYGDGAYAAGQYKPNGAYTVLDAQGNDTGRTGQWGNPNADKAYLAAMAIMAGGGALAGSGAFGAGAGAGGTGGVTVGGPMSVGGATGVDLGTLGTGTVGATTVGSGFAPAASTAAFNAATSAGGTSLLDAAGKYILPAATIASGVIGSQSAKDAAKIQADATSQANQTTKDIYNKQIELLDPYRRAGLSAENRLMTLLGLTAGPSATGLDGKPVAGGDQSYGDPTDPEFGSLMKDPTMADLQLDPGYQFRMDQGNQGLERSAAARGGLLSGRAMKDAMNYNQGAASQEYQNAFNRFQTNRTNKLNPLQSLMGVGQTSSTSLSSDAGNAGSQISKNQTDLGNVTAASQIAQGNAWTNALNQGTSQYQQNNLINKIFPG